MTVFGLPFLTRNAPSCLFSAPPQGWLNTPPTPAEAHSAGWQHLLSRPASSVSAVLEGGTERPLLSWAEVRLFGLSMFYQELFQPVNFCTVVVAIGLQNYEERNVWPGAGTGAIRKLGFTVNSTAGTSGHLRNGPLCPGAPKTSRSST